MNKPLYTIAIPVTNGQFCTHFGHCSAFELYTIEDNAVAGKKTIQAPQPHQPGQLPKWLAKQDVQVVIAGGIGERALLAFEHFNIEVLRGAECGDPDDLVRRYLEKRLVLNENACDHGHKGHGHCH